MLSLVLSIWISMLLSVRALRSMKQAGAVASGTFLGRCFMTTQQEEPSPSRFWSRSIEVTSAQISGSQTKAEALESAIGALQDSDEAKKVSVGMAIADMGSEQGFLIPIHEGMVQRQHILATKTEGAAGKILLCAFNPRAQPNELSPAEQERPIDPERLAALNKELTEMGILPEDLMGNELAGTSPAKIYRSFVCPRLGKAHLIEPIERAAKRTASQLELSLRQVRADQSEYLRNIDKSQDVMSMKEDRGDSENSGSTGGSSASTARHPVVLLLDNVRSAFNVGSLFRTGETAGIQEIVTAGITAHPPHPKLRKTAMQSLEAVPTRHYDNVMDAVRALKEEGYTIVVMETTSKSALYTDTKYPEKTCLVLGNEITGVDTRIIDLADMVVEIPTYGVKNSLNVASAGPIVVFEVLRQWHLRDEQQ